jgi:SAM-dependent methyltransferase
MKIESEPMEKCIACASEIATSQRVTLSSLPFFYGVKNPSIEAKLDAKGYDGVLAFCSNCGLIQQSSSENTEEILKAVYQSESSGLSAPMSHSGWGKSRADAFFKNTSFMKRPTSVLEIGCQDGYILREMVTRFNVTKAVGVEPGVKEIDTLDGRIEFHGDFFQNCPLVENSFDTIISCFVLEHISDPLSFLKSIRKLLTVDGQLVISVPNTESRFESGDPGVFVHEHISYFTEDALYNLFSLSGFDIVNLQKTQNDFYLVASAKLLSVNHGLRIPTNVLPDFKMKLASVISSFRKKVSGKQVVFWGACSTTANLVSLTGVRSYQVVDSDPKKQRYEVSGLNSQILSPDDLANLKDTHSIVCIAPFGFGREIEKSLISKYNGEYFYLFEQPNACQ